MTSAEMVKVVKDRTHHPKDDKVLNELNSAKNWAYSRLFNTENGPDQLMTFDTEIILPGTGSTRNFDLALNISSTQVVMGIKKLWLRLTSESDFTPMVSRDSTDPKFLANDQYPSSDTTTVANGHPVYFDAVNFSKVRFSPPLPASSVLRADVWLQPPDIDTTTNTTLTYGSDLPLPLHDSVVDKATSQVFSIMDDSRWAEWDAKAERKLVDALHLVNRRVQSPTRIRGFHVRSRRPF